MDKLDRQTPMRTRHIFASIALCIVVGALATISLLSVTAEAASKKPTQPIFVATRGGGFVPFGFDQRALSVHIILADGRHYQPGPVTAEYPGPALYPVVMSKLSKSEVAAFDKRAKKAGLNQMSVDFGIPNTADVPALVTTYRSTQQIILSWGVGEEGLSKAQRSNRARVKSFLAPLETLNGKIVVPTSVVLTSQVVDTARVVDTTQVSVIDWPTASKPLASVGRCLVLTGPEAMAALVVLSKQNALTQYRSDGKVFEVFGRIAVPGDRGCGPKT